MDLRGTDTLGKSIELRRQSGGKYGDGKAIPRSDLPRQRVDSPCYGIDKYCTSKDWTSDGKQRKRVTVICYAGEMNC